MTTNFLDNKICTFKILLSWRFPRKDNSILNDVPLSPKVPPSKSGDFFIFIVVSPSLSNFVPPKSSERKDGFKKVRVKFVIFDKDVLDRL